MKEKLEHTAICFLFWVIAPMAAILNILSSEGFTRILFSLALVLFLAVDAWWLFLMVDAIDDHDHRPTATQQQGRTTQTTPTFQERMARWTALYERNGH